LKAHHATGRCQADLSTAPPSLRQRPYWGAPVSGATAWTLDRGARPTLHRPAGSRRVSRRCLPPHSRASRS